MPDQPDYLARFLARMLGVSQPPAPDPVLRAQVASAMLDPIANARAQKRIVDLVRELPGFDPAGRLKISTCGK